MSDITEPRRPGASRAPDARDETTEQTTVASVVPAYQQSSALDALQELVDVAAQVPTPLGPVELARALGVTWAASSGVVDRLVARGHAERRPHAADGRRTEVVVTESGRREVFTMLAPMFAKLAEIDADLDDDERAVVERYLRGAIAAMRAVT